MPFDATPIEPQVVRDLRAARAYLVEHGWCQGEAFSGRFGKSPACTWGACKAIKWRDYGEMYEALCQACGDINGGAIRWNDAKGRTFEEVLDLFDRAINTELAKATTYEVVS